MQKNKNMYYSRISDFLGYQLKRPHRRGHGIHSPFLYQFVTTVLLKSRETPGNISNINSLRRALLNNNSIIQVEDMGAGSLNLKSRERRIKDIARFSSTSQKYGILFHRLTHYLQPRTIVETGTCLGLGTLYLASGYPESKIITLEGSKTLGALASKHFRQLGYRNIRQMTGNFEDTLPKALEMSGTCDLIYVDGNHTREATLHYFRIILRYTNENTIVLFDDIRWSAEMKEAWDTICLHEKVTLSVDLFQLGLIFFNTKLNKQHFQIYY